MTEATTVSSGIAHHQWQAQMLVMLADLDHRNDDAAADAAEAAQALHASIAAHTALVHSLCLAAPGAALDETLAARSSAAHYRSLRADRHAETSAAALLAARQRVTNALMDRA
jgi:hypothetical protein